MAVTIVDTARPVTGGVDTHLDVHVAAALDGIGGLLGVEEFDTTVSGSKALLGWLAGFGTVARVGVEGTGSYGAGLARYLRRAGVEVVEVDRPNRQERRRKGKTDTVDAIEAARAAQAGRQLGAAKTRDGNVEAIRALVVAKRSATECRIKTMNQIRHLGFTAPEEIRQQLHGLSTIMLPRKAAAMRPRSGSDPVVYATKMALRTLGRRALALEAEKKELKLLLRRLVSEQSADLLSLYGVGVGGVGWWDLHLWRRGLLRVDWQPGAEQADRRDVVPLNRNRPKWYGGSRAHRLCAHRMTLST